MHFPAPQKLGPRPQTPVLLQHPILHGLEGELNYSSVKEQVMPYIIREYEGLIERVISSCTLFKEKIS